MDRRIALVLCVMVGEHRDRYRKARERAEGFYKQDMRRLEEVPEEDKERYAEMVGRSRKHLEGLARQEAIAEEALEALREEIA